MPIPLCKAKELESIMKKSLSLLLAFIMCISVFSFTVSAADNVKKYSVTGWR